MRSPGIPPRSGGTGVGDSAAGSPLRSAGTAADDSAAGSPSFSDANSAGEKKETLHFLHFLNCARMVHTIHRGALSTDMHTSTYIGKPKRSRVHTFTVCCT